MAPLAHTRFFFDYVDPASFLVEVTLAAIERERGGRVERVPFEICPPPTPLLDPREETWSRRCAAVAEIARGRGMTLAEPGLIPWSRKAHELARHAEEVGRFEEIHRALFQARTLEGMDLGRVDVLLELAVRHGLDRTRTKAVLDVDRHAPAVAEARLDAERLGVRGVPTLLAGRRMLEGLQDRDTILSFLTDAGDG